MNLLKRAIHSMFLLVFLFMTSSAVINAQNTTGITGIVKDSIGGDVLEYTSLAIYKSTDSALVAGTVTDHFGKFTIDKLAPGVYFLSVHFIGYEPKILENLNLTSASIKNLGTVNLNVSSSALGQVNVSADRAVAYHKLDRQVYDASKFQSSEGGNAVDVLRNMPSVSVGANGEISVRGAQGFMMLINGKPIQSDPTTFLQQIPANAVKDVEIITTPSAKFDPDGKAGIINIKTKQGAGDGIYLLVNGNIGLPSVEDYDNPESQKRYGGDFTLNYLKNKWNVSLGADYTRNDIAGRRVGFVNTTVDNRYTEFPSEGERSFDNYNYSGRATVQYNLNEHNNFTAGFYAGKRTKYRTADILYHNVKTDLNSMTTISDIQYFNSNLQTRKGDFLIGSLDYMHKFDNNGKLSTSLLYEYSMLGGPTYNRNLAFPNLSDTIQYTVNDNDNPLNGYRANLDYSLPLGRGTLEAGYQFRFLNHTGDFYYKVWDTQTDVFNIDPQFSNSIDLKRQIHSLYGQYNGSTNKLDYTAGLRLEYMEREVKLGNEPKAFLYDNLSLFPSVNLLYHLSEGWNLKAGYSRRIERTTTFKMNPFPEREHSETLEQGDAKLLPEYIDVVEAGFVKTFKGNNSVFGNVYYRNIHNVINRVNNVYNDTILNRIYTNAGRAEAYGLELGTEFNVTPWWNIYAGGNVYNYSIKGELFNNAVNVNASDLIYSINANTTIRFNKTTNFQWNLNYISKRITAQGEDGAYLSPNASFRKQFLGGRLTATLQWLNMDMGLLKSNEQRISTWGNDFYTTTNYMYEVDVFMVNLSYKLNQPGKTIKFTKSEFGEKEF